jgi:hypothetical protein
MILLDTPDFEAVTNPTLHSLDMFITSLIILLLTVDVQSGFLLSSLGLTSKSSYSNSSRQPSSYSMGSFRSSGSSIRDKVVKILDMGTGCSGPDLTVLHPLEDSVAATLMCNPLRPATGFQSCVEDMFPDAYLSSSCNECIGMFLENLFPSCWKRVLEGTFSRSKCVEIITTRLQKSCLP